MKWALILVSAALYGQSLADWTVPPVLKSLGYSVEVRQEGCRGTAGCAVLLAPAKPPGGVFGNLAQTFDAAPYRGRTVRLRALVREEAVGPSDHAQMWLKVNLAGGEAGFSDDMGDRPIVSTEWKSYEITGAVPLDAESVSVGIMWFGTVRAWIEGVVFETLPDEAGTGAAAARETFQKLYARVDAAYQEGDVDAIASLALPDARIHLGSGDTTLSAALLQIMEAIDKGAKYSSHSTVTNVRVVGDEATVAANNRSSILSKDGTAKDGQPVLISTNRDTWTRTAGGWKLKESTLISSHSVTPPTDPVSAEAVLAGLKASAVPLKGVQAGAPADDLAAFGAAVGDARIVSLGEASHGTREFVQMKHRLLEYLVKQKGFTVLALEANWPETLALDRYIKTGEGDPKALLAGLNGWRWNNQEMLDLVRWMHDFNQTPGAHATLTLTSFDMRAGHAAAQKVIEYLTRYSVGDADSASNAYADAQVLEEQRDQVYDDRAQSAADRAATVMRALDTKREALVQQSSAEAWRDARQAASIVYQSCLMHVPDHGPAWRDEMMAANVEWLASMVHPNEKMVIWSDNDHARSVTGPDGRKSMGAWLREPYAKEMYVVGFAFRRGEVRAVGVENGKVTGLQVYDAAASGGTGDGILGSAGVPLFFLNLAGVPAGSALGRWLAQPHLFYNPGGQWVPVTPNSAPGGDPDANHETASLTKLYDGLIYVDESHPTALLTPR